MSNEYKDWFCDVMTELNTRMREADFLPEGWTNTFIPKMKQELADVLGSYVYDFDVLQIKDKYGMMRFYWSWADRDYNTAEEQDRNELTNKIETIINKYEVLSANTCVVCGNPAVKMTSGWILPVCREHEHL